MNTDTRVFVEESADSVSTSVLAIDDDDEERLRGALAVPKTDAGFAALSGFFLAVASFGHTVPTKFEITRRVTADGLAFAHEAAENGVEGWRKVAPLWEATRDDGGA